MKQDLQNLLKIIFTLNLYKGYGCSSSAQTTLELSKKIQSINPIDQGGGASTNVGVGVIGNEIQCIDENNTEKEKLTNSIKIDNQKMQGNYITVNKQDQSGGGNNGLISNVSNNTNSKPSLKVNSTISTNSNEVNKFINDQINLHFAKFLPKINIDHFTVWARNYLKVDEFFEVFEIVPNPLKEREIIRELMKRNSQNTELVQNNIKPTNISKKAVFYVISWRWFWLWRYYINVYYKEYLS